KNTETVGLASAAAGSASAASAQARTRRKRLSLLAPLDAAADGRGPPHRRLAAVEHGVERVAEVVLLDRVLVAMVVDRAVVDELPLAAEEERLRRPLRLELARKRLVLVPQVVEVELLLLRAPHHLGERVLRVA